MTDLDDVIGLDEAADITGRAPVTLRRAASLGRLRAKKIGRPGSDGSSSRQLWITTREALSDYLAYVAAEAWQSVPQRIARPGGRPRRRPRTRGDTTA